jgi:uncharacterized membrane protein
MPNIHPLLVHFPITLIMVLAVVDIIALATKKEIFLRLGTVLTVFALIGTAAAVLTGVLAEETVWHPESAEPLIEKHELLGFVVLGLVAVIFIIRLAASRRLSGPMGLLSLILALAASAVVGYSAYLGGEMVYRYGTGVAPAQAQSDMQTGDQRETNDEETSYDEEEEAEGSEESE